MIEINGKTYRLEEAYVIPESEVDTVWGKDWGEPDTYEVDVARSEVKVTKCFVLVEELQND